MLNETNIEIIKKLIDKPISDSDIENIETFIKVTNSDVEKRYVEINCKLKALRLTKNVQFQYALKHPILCIKHYFWDLDFGPIDRILRLIRRRQLWKVLALSDTTNMTLVDVGCGRQANVGWV